MLPLKQYTLEDFYKFYRTVTPMIDKMVSESEYFEKHKTIGFEQHQLRDALKADFQEEANLPPIAFRQFVDRMMEEMECPRIKPCEERTGVSWYGISAYLNMRQLNPGVHDCAFACQVEAHKKERDKDADFLKMNITRVFDFSSFYIYGNRCEEFKTIADLIQIMPNELLQIRGVGVKTLQKVREVLGGKGYYLKEDKKWFENNFEWSEKHQSYLPKY